MSAAGGRRLGDPDRAGSPRPVRERIEVPGATVEAVYRPTSVGDVAEILAAFDARGAGVLVCGGRTRLAQANPAGKLAAAVSLGALAGIDVFEPDEGVVHALAGTPIRALRAAVAAEGWELPLDPPGPAATLGGTIASAATGPRAHALGRVADAVLGLEVVGADGTISKCGGRVVKNVTGYDLAKLYTGSFGSLGVITGAWLRLRPEPGCRVVLAGRVPADSATFERARAAAAAASVRAFVWNEAPGDADAEIVVELGASEAAVAHDRASLAGAFPLAPADPAALDLLRDGRAQDAAGAAIGARARVLATRLDALRQAVIAANLKVSIDIGLGVVTARGASAAFGLDGPPTLAALRAQAEAWGGHLSCEWLPAAWHAALDVFGEQPGTRALAAALKQRFDPRGILNPGRFVAGT